MLCEYSSACNGCNDGNNRGRMAAMTNIAYCYFTNTIACASFMHTVLKSLRGTPHSTAAQWSLEDRLRDTTCQPSTKQSMTISFDRVNLTHAAKLNNIEQHQGNAYCHDSWISMIILGTKKYCCIRLVGFAL